MKRDNGFTLVEILMVVMILGLASFLIIPHLGSAHDLKTSSAARLVMADLIYAQNRAITTQKMHFVRFDAAADRYELLTSISPYQVIEHPIHGTDYVVAFGSGEARQLDSVEIVSASFDGQPVLGFDELGTPHYYDPSDGLPKAMIDGKITMRSGDYTLTISIEPYTGEIRVQ